MIRTHFATLIGTKGRPLVREIVLQLVAPVALAGATVYFAVRLTIAAEIIAGATVLSGFLFGLLIFVFQLRLSMSVDPRVQSKADLPVLIDQLFANVVYAVAVSFVLTVGVVVATATEPRDEEGVLIGLDPWVSGGLVLLAAHLLAVVAMSIRRTRSAYGELKS